MPIGEGGPEPSSPAVEIARERPWHVGGGASLAHPNDGEEPITRLMNSLTNSVGVV